MTDTNIYHVGRKEIGEISRFAGIDIDDSIDVFNERHGINHDEHAEERLEFKRFIAKMDGEAVAVYFSDTEGL